MSMLPAFRAEFDMRLTDDECKNIAKDVKNMKGVLSVSFSKAASDDTKRCMHVTYVGAANVESDVKKIKGITKTQPMM